MLFCEMFGQEDDNQLYTRERTNPVAPARDTQWVNCEFSWPICFMVKNQVIIRAERHS
jgi:hypothetical protein